MKWLWGAGVATSSQSQHRKSGHPARPLPAPGPHASEPLSPPGRHMTPVWDLAPHLIWWPLCHQYLCPGSQIHPKAKDEFTCP